MNTIEFLVVYENIKYIVIVNYYETGEGHYEILANNIWAYTFLLK